MVIIALADIHGQINSLPAIGDCLTEADLILIAGDITNFGARAEASRILSAISKYNTHILAVTGNCDRPGVDDYLRIENINLSGNCVNLNGLAFVGVGQSLSHSDSSPKELTAEQLDVRLRQLETKISSTPPVVLLTHQPAKNMIVAAANGSYTANSVIADFIARNNPLLAISGHSHKAAIDHAGETTLVNPGPFRDGSYAYIEITEKVDKTEIRTAR